MHRTKEFMHDLAEEMKEKMGEMKGESTVKQLSELAEIAEDYNEICEAICNMKKYDEMMDEAEGVVMQVEHMAKQPVAHTEERQGGRFVHGVGPKG